MKSCETCLRGPVTKATHTCMECECSEDRCNYIEVTTFDEDRIDVIAQNGNDGIAYPDPIVETVREKLKMRSEAGMLKYGVTLSRKDLSKLDWLRHAQDEALDLANYLEVLIQREVA